MYAQPFIVRDMHQFTRLLRKRVRPIIGAASCFQVVVVVKYSWLRGAFNNGSEFITCGRFALKYRPGAERMMKWFMLLLQKNACMLLHGSLMIAGQEHAIAGPLATVEGMDALCVCGGEGGGGKPQKLDTVSIGRGPLSPFGANAEI
jgi:hypothetical protein